MPSLDALHGSGRYAPLIVVSQPDRPRGRGQKPSPTPVRARARELGIDTCVMSRANYDAVARDLVALAPDAIVVVAFGIIVKKDLLEAPRHGCINLHGSLLPRHRGVAPVQAAILAGDTATGVTTMRMDEGIDTGDILLSEATPIDPTDTTGTLMQRLAMIGANLMVRTLDGLFDGTLAGTPQDHTLATKTRKIKKSDGAIAWDGAVEDVARRVRAMTPWPSAFTFVGGRRLIVVEAAPVAGDAADAPGTVVSLSPLRVCCGSGLLEIRRVRPEGKATMGADQYVAGHALAEGDVLSS